MSDLAMGILMLVAAGAMNASFTVPMKFSRKWAWENTWLAWSVIALLILPPVVAYFAVPDLADVYMQAGWAPLLIVIACGAGWGISQVCFGLAVDAIGIASAFAIILGVSGAVGGTVDLVTKHVDKVHSSAGATVLLGVVLLAAGVAVCAVAGRQREVALGRSLDQRSFLRGVVYCLIGGVGAALIGLGLAWGTHVVRAAKSAGAPEIWRATAVWLPLMVAGAIPNVIYCIYLLRKNGTAQRFKEPGTGTYWALAAVMAVLWFGSTLLYGMSLTYVGALGAAVVWPAYMAMIVLIAAAAGMLTGEWKKAGKGPIRIQMAGTAILLIAIVVLSRGM